MLPLYRRCVTSKTGSAASHDTVPTTKNSGFPTFPLPVDPSGDARCVQRSGQLHSQQHERVGAVQRPRDALGALLQKGNSALLQSSSDAQDTVHKQV